MRAVAAIAVVDRALAIGHSGELDEIAHLHRLTEFGTEIEGPCERRPFPQLLRKDEIAAYWLENMLPRSHRIRPAHPQRAPRLPGAHSIGNKTVLGPVTTADHIAGARAC